MSSGTVALYLAVRVLGISPRDGVYVRVLTFVTSAPPILIEHAVPVLIDSEPLSWNMLPIALERKIIEDRASGDLE